MCSFNYIFSLSDTKYESYGNGNRDCCVVLYAGIIISPGLALNSACTKLTYFSKIVAGPAFGHMLQLFYALTHNDWTMALQLSVVVFC